MQKFFRWFDPRTDDDLSVLDTYLQRTLVPVFPSPSFVQDLQSRLLRRIPVPRWSENHAHRSLHVRDDRRAGRSIHADDHWDPDADWISRSVGIGPKN